MSARRGLDDYRTVLDPGRLRRRLLTRAAIAAGAIVLMLAGLMFFGGEEGEPPARATGLAVTTTSALPVLPAMPLAKPVSETPPEVAAAATAAPAPRDETVATDQPAAASEPVASAVSQAVPEPEPPIMASGADAAPLAATQTEAPDVALPATRNTADSASTVSKVRQGAPALSASAGAVMAAGGFSAHLGEYGPLDNAERLRQSLTEQGLPAALVRRVVIGPVSTRQSAEQIVARLRQDGQVAGFIVPAGGKGFLVQAGVFADPGNAETQQRRLSTSARKATIQGRVVLGPYASREEADAVLAKVRRERKIAGTIVAAAR